MSALDNVGSTAIPVEIVRALTVVLPCVQETYDGFWSQILAWLPKLWSSLSFRIDDEVALLHGTLKLLAMLRRLVAEESNDDLVDAWKESEASMGNGLINLLQLLRGMYFSTSQGISIHCCFLHPPQQKSTGLSVQLGMKLLKRHNCSTL